MAHLGGDHFVKSADQSYNHPAAGAGGFAGDEINSRQGSGLSSNQQQHGLGSGLSSNQQQGLGSDSYGSGQQTSATAETLKSYGGSAPQGQQDFSQNTAGSNAYGSSGVGAGLGTDLDSARLASKHDRNDEYAYGASQSGNDSGLGARGAAGLGGAALGGAGIGSALGHNQSGHSEGLHHETSSGYGASSLGSGTGGTVGSGIGSGHHSSSNSSGADALRDIRNDAERTANSSQQYGSHGGQGAAYGAAGAGAAGAAAYGANKLDSDPSKGGYSGSGVGGDNAKNLTSDSRVNDTIGKKIEENTDKDGFTNLTGDKQPGGVLTGRVKNDANSSDSPVVETTKKRSDRDEQGRELDSYGNPYTL